MNNPTNMRVIISKLPFKMRERWRVHAFDLQELRKRRARFAEIMNFVDRQAKIISDPLFGDLNTATAEKKDTKMFQQGITAKKGGSFATIIELIGDKQSYQDQRLMLHHLIVHLLSRVCFVERTTPWKTVKGSENNHTKKEWSF